MKDKRNLLAKQVIALEAKAIVTGRDEDYERAEKKLEEYCRIERKITGGKV